MKNLTSNACSAIPISYKGDKISRLSHLVFERSDARQTDNRHDGCYRRLSHLQCVRLIMKKFYINLTTALLFMAIFLQHSSSQSTSVSSTLEALAMLCHINSRFILHYIMLLTYLQLLHERLKFTFINNLLQFIMLYDVIITGVLLCGRFPVVGLSQHLL